MTLLAQIRDRRLRPRVAREAAIYDGGPARAAEAQLVRLNAAWAESLRASPWARAQRRRHDLPERFESWSSFERLAPVQRRADLRALIGSTPGASADIAWRATGGSTAEPLRFPVLKGETEGAQVDMWLGRARFGVTPSDRLFLIWGHAHLFGSGAAGVIARMRRQLSDRALGYARWSAYALSPADLRRAGDALIASRARYVIGYSSALDRFARANLDRAAAFRDLGLKVAIATAEGFPQADSREVIAACLGCAAVMEYGSVETGAMAYERPGGGYDVFWARHRLEAVADGAGGDELVVTSLYPRALPLLRYAIGDRVAADDRTAPLVALRGVLGRCNDAVRLPGGAVIHSEAFSHAVRDTPQIRAFQVVQRADGLPLLRYEADEPLAPAAVDRIHARLAMIDPALRAAPLEQALALAVSPAGKHQMVVSEPWP